LVGFVWVEFFLVYKNLNEDITKSNMSESFNGGRFVIKFGDNDQGLVEIMREAELKNVPYNYFVPKFIGYFQLLPTHKNEYNKNKKENWVRLKEYSDQTRKTAKPVVKFIDLSKGNDVKMWNGTLKSKKDFFKIAVNKVKTDSLNEYVFAVCYIDYEKDTKSVFRQCISQNPRITVGEFVDSNMYKNLLKYVKRNAQKFSYDVSTRMNFNVDTQVDIQFPVREGKPLLIDFDKYWILNQFATTEDFKLICYHNTIPVPNKGEVIRVSQSGFTIPLVDIPEENREDLPIFQVFEQDFRNVNLFTQNKVDNLSVHYASTNKSLNVRPEKFIKNVKRVKILESQISL